MYTAKQKNFKKNFFANNEQFVVIQAKYSFF